MKFGDYTRKIVAVGCPQTVADRQTDRQKHSLQAIMLYISRSDAKLKCKIFLTPTRSDMTI